MTGEPLKCRHCGRPATKAVRSGFEDHPECDECAAWRDPDRHGPLSNVAPDYHYDPQTYR